MNQKTKESVVLILIGIIFTLIGWMGPVLHTSNTLLDLVSIVFAIMAFMGPPALIAGMVLAIKSVDSSKTKLLVAIASVLALLVVGFSYAVYMHKESVDLEAKSEAYAKCELIEDKKSLHYSSCRNSARRLP